MRRLLTRAWPDQSPLAADSHIITLTANTAQVEGQGVKPIIRNGSFERARQRACMGTSTMLHNDIAHAGAKAQICVEIHVPEFVDTAVASQENISNPKPHTHVQL